MPALSTEDIRAKIANGTIFAISIDTAIFDKYGCNLEYAVLKKLDQFKTGAISVLLSEIVVKEVRDHIAREAEETQRKLKKAIKDQQKRWQRKLDLSVLPSELAIMENPAEAADIQIDEYLKSIGADIVPAAGAVEVTQELLRRYFGLEPPFEGKEKKRYEFPDAFALLSLEAFAKQRKKLLLCVSPDKGWREFAAQSDSLVCVADLDDALSPFNQSGRNTADKIVALWRTGSASDLANEVERAFEYRLDDLDFHADGHSTLEFESEPISAVMQWVDARTASDPIVIAADDKSVTFTISIETLVAFEAEFSFYVKDSIDRDYIALGSQTYSTEDKFHFELAITVLRNIDAEDRVVDVDVGRKHLDVDFGFVEPFPGEDPTHEKY